PAWRMDPTYLKTEPEETVHVTNEGGRNHTFTEVAHYGGGRVSGLSKGLTEGPGCGSAPAVRAGGRENVAGLTVGLYEIPECGHSRIPVLHPSLDACADQGSGQGGLSRSTPPSRPGYAHYAWRHTTRYRQPAGGCPWCHQRRGCRLRC